LILPPHASRERRATVLYATGDVHLGPSLDPRNRIDAPDFGVHAITTAFLREVDIPAALPTIGDMARNAASPSPSLDRLAPQHARVALRTLRPLAAYLRNIGCDAAGMFASAGIDPLGLFDPNAHIPLPLLLEAWRRAEALSGDPNIGLRVVENIDVRLFDRMQYETEWVVIQLFVVSATVGEGLARLTRYFPVGFYGSQIDLRRHDKTVRVRHRVVGTRETPRSFSEFILSLLVRQIHELPSRPVKPRGIFFAHAAPASRGEHERILPAPVEFSAGEDIIVLDEDDLEVPMRGANPRLASGLEHHASEILARLPPLESIIDQVRALIAAELPGGNPNAEHIASALQMSTRTLSRRLDELGTSHKALLDEVRAALARRYLVEERRAVNEVSSLLGFSETSAFHRAFRRWYGQSPTDFRRDTGGDGEA